MKLHYSEVCPVTACDRGFSPIVFIHGLYESKITWKNVAPIIAQNTGRKAYALDARNHGESPRSPVMNSEVMAKDVLEFLDNLNIEKAILCGHSMGGRTAINIALKHPERVSALVVEDMSPQNMESEGLKLAPLLSKMGMELLKHFPPEMELDDVKREYSEIMMKMIGKDYADVEKAWKNYDPEMIGIVKEGSSFVPVPNIKPIWSMMERNFLVQDLPAQDLIFDADALFLYGTIRPFFILDEDASVKKMFPRAVVKKIEGASHFIHHDSPDEYSQVVSDFIRKITDQSSTSDAKEETFNI